MPSLEDLTTDQLLAAARSMQGSAELINTLSKNPETRRDLQKLIKKQFPDRVIPELDTELALETRLAEERTRFEALETKVLEREIHDRLKSQRAAAQAKHKLTDAEMIEVEKLMVHEDPNERIPGYEAASRVFAASKQNATPTPSGIQNMTFEMPDKDTWADGIGSPAKLNKIAMNEATKAWNEARGLTQPA
jgi:hypothetical protein